MFREKYNLIQELQRKAEELKGKKRLSMVGQGDFTAANNPVRSTMNSKHHTQHLAIDNPEFPFYYDGKENVAGKYSSFHTTADRSWKIIKIIKKYDGLLKGRSNFALYFLYDPKTDSYRVEERRVVENLTENYGFDYNNDYLDGCQEGDTIEEGDEIIRSTSYDDYGNVGLGVNGRILYGIHPMVQDDAIICSESFAKRMVTNNVTSVVIPVNEDTIILNRYGTKDEYQGLPDIGDHLDDGIVAATRTIRETRMFSDLRDASLQHIVESDQVFYGTGEVIDINVYCNNPNIKSNRVNKQILQYYTDAKWFYTDVYRTCKKILKSGSKNIHREINRWMRKAMNYLDTQAVWAFNENVFSNLMIEILLRRKDCIKVGRKLTGRAGNKTVTCSIWPDEEMPYLTERSYTDEYGVVHPEGVRKRVDLITNPLALINRTIPKCMEEGSVTFLMDRARKHAATLDDLEEQRAFLFDVLTILNPKQGKEVEELYATLSKREQREFIQDMISVEDGLLITSNGMYLRSEVFTEEINCRDNIIKVYEKYPDIFRPYNIFVPKPRWGRDIYIGKDHVGYQYMMVLKQSGEKGFSVRSAGSISDESLPEKSNSNKIHRSWCSTKPIRFGEYETPQPMCLGRIS